MPRCITSLILPDLMPQDIKVERSSHVTSNYCSRAEEEELRGDGVPFSGKKKEAESGISSRIIMYCLM